MKKTYPNEAEELFAEAQKMAQLRYKTYIRKAAGELGRLNPHEKFRTIPLSKEHPNLSDAPFRYTT